MGGRTIKCFEDIQAWQQGRELTCAIYAITKSSCFTKDYSLREQIRRAAISIMLNIAEGFARSTDKEFRRYLMQAHGSAAEVQAALYIALDQKYISQTKFDELYASLDSLSRKLMKFAEYLKNSNKRVRGSDSRLSTPDSKTQK